MKKKREYNSFEVKRSEKQKVIFIPYKFNWYNFFASFCGLFFIVLTIYSLDSNDGILNIFLKAIPGVFGIILVYSVVVDFLNYKFKKIIIVPNIKKLKVVNLIRIKEVEFNDVSEFKVYIDKLEGITDSSAVYRGPDTLSVVIEILTIQGEKIRLFNFPPHQILSKELKLIEELKKDSKAFINEIGIKRSISWEIVFN